MVKLSAAQRYAVSKLTSTPQSAYRLQVSLATLRALVKKGYAKDVTKPGAGSMFSPATHFEFTKVETRE